MRVTNEPGRPEGPSGAFAELFRLQSDFQARLAEETLRYLRRLQGAVVPAAPGTVVLPQEGLVLRAGGRPGGRTELSIEIENLQRVHCMVTPQLTPLASADGVTWFPATDAPTASRLLAPGAADRLVVPLAIPVDLPPGEYRGAMLLQGFRRNSLAVVISVGETEIEKAGTPEPADAKAAAASKKSASKKSAAKKSGSRSAEKSAGTDAEAGSAKASKHTAGRSSKKRARGRSGGRGRSS